MTNQLTLQELEQAEERELGSSNWVTIEQQAIEQFADATGDHQWIHVDPEAAAQGPFGTTIAHGYLSLSLIPPLLSQVLQVTDARMGINYGIEKIRFTSPVPTGSEVRLHAKLKSSERRGEGILFRVEVQVEIKGQDKPALVGEVLYITF